MFCLNYCRINKDIMIIIIITIVIITIKKAIINLVIT